MAAPPEGAAAGGNRESNFGRPPPAPPEGSRAVLLSRIAGEEAEAREAPRQEARDRSPSPPVRGPHRPDAAAGGEVERAGAPLTRGDRVRIRGFVANADFNGSRGRVVEVAPDRRYHVSLLGELLGITLRWVKRENLGGPVQ